MLAYCAASLYLLSSFATPVNVFSNLRFGSAVLKLLRYISWQPLKTADQGGTVSVDLACSL